MRKFLLLGGDRRLIAHVREILGDEWQIDETGDWSHVVTRLLSADPPQLLLCCGSVLSPTAARTLVELRRKGYLIPTSIYFEKPTPALAYLAGRLHRHRVHTIFGPEELESGLRALLRRAMTDLGETLVRMLGVETSLARRLLSLMDRKRELLTETPDELAYELRCSRSSLYRGLRAAGLPPPGAIQALYRLWPGVARIVAGGRGGDAALEAQSPHYASFRKAVFTHFGLTIGQLRAAPDLDWVLRRWVDFHQLRAPAGVGSRRPLAPLDRPLGAERRLVRARVTSPRGPIDPKR